MKTPTHRTDIRGMTAPRTCRACGAALPGDVRWCLLCYEPVRELTPREPVWAPGGFVDNPVNTGGQVPHWSRWEKSPTTIGPVGRISATIVFLATVPMAASAGAFLYVLLVPATAYMVLPAIWARGWVVPGEIEQVRPVTSTKPDPHPEPPLTKAMLAWRGIWMTGVLGACLVFAYSPTVAAKASVLGLAAIVGLVMFWRGFFVR
jgi:hypothetical protein